MQKAEQAKRVRELERIAWRYEARWRINAVLLLLLLGGLGLSFYLLRGSQTGRYSAAAYENPDATLFRAELLYASANHYARDHAGRLPESNHWETDLAPYFPRGISPIFLSRPGEKPVRRFVMNRALGEMPLDALPNRDQIPLFWQAKGDTSAADAADIARSGLRPCYGVTANGSPVSLGSDGDAKLVLYSAHYSNPRENR